MLCTWTIAYEPTTVELDPEYGSEPGARYHLTSNWDDDFTVLCCPTDGRGYTLVTQWARAEDSGVVPGYFLDCLPDLTAIVVGSQVTGSTGYQVDLAARTGNQTARDLWLIENPE